MNQQKKLYTELKNHVKLLRDFILDLLFPIECLKCKTPGTWLCKKCFRELKYNNKPYCLHCYKENDLGNFCRTCKNKFSLNGVMIAGNYSDKTLAVLIKSFKYNFNHTLSTTLGNYLSIFLKNSFNLHLLKKNDIKKGLPFKKFAQIKQLPIFMLDFKNTILIPVPLHTKRFKWRGFNQAELIAKVIAKNFSLKIDTKNLKRKKQNIAQATLKGKKRYKNLKNNFSWEGEKLSQKNILLVDDIVTTGTTLNECAKTLKKAGAHEVWGLVIAKG